MSELAKRLEQVSSAVRDADWGGLGQLLSARFFGHEPSDGEPSASERVIGLLSDMKTAIPDLEVSFDEIEGGPDEVTAVLGLTGTHEHALWGSSGSGAAVAWTSPVTVRRFDDGLAIRFDDTSVPALLAALRQIGLVNPPDRMDQPPVDPVSIPEFLLKVVLTGQAANKPCSHLEQIAVVEPTTRVCAQCVAEGTNWPALRMCLTCGFVGCCDTSKNKHMHAHHEATGHPLMRSVRMDEGWVWCYPDGAFFERSVLEGRGTG